MGGRGHAGGAEKPRLKKSKALKEEYAKCTVYASLRNVHLTAAAGLCLGHQSSHIHKHILEFSKPQFISIAAITIV